jgi:hypothetical protein
MQERSGILSSIRAWVGLLVFGLVILFVCSNLAAVVTLPLGLGGYRLLQRWRAEPSQAAVATLLSLVGIIHLVLTLVLLRYVGATSQAVRTLIVKYLWRRWIAWVALVAVMLCTTMVLVVISVMGGWLDMFESTARGLTGDVVIKSPSLSGFPYYEEMIEQIENDPELKEISVRGDGALRADLHAHPNRQVVFAAPAIATFGVVNIENRKTDAVQVIGYPLEKIGQVN